MTLWALLKHGRGNCESWDQRLFPGGRAGFLNSLLRSRNSMAKSSKEKLAHPEVHVASTEPRGWSYGDAEGARRGHIVGVLSTSKRVWTLWSVLGSQ